MKKLALTDILFLTFFAFVCFGAPIAELLLF